MKLARSALLGGAMTAVLLISACGDKGSKAPSGQVVATVDGKEVTVHEMNAEMQGLPKAADADKLKLIQSVALARVIERKTLVAEAQKRGLDKNPQYLVARERGNEQLLVQALQSDVVKGLPPTTREAAQKFISDNPGIFGDRKVYTLDQIQFLRPANFETLGLKDAKTMGDVEKLLTDANIEYRRAPQQIDSLTTDPRLVDAIGKVTTQSKGEPFMLSNQPPGAPAPVIYISLVTDTKTKPFIGEQAISYAQQVLQRQETQKRLVDSLKKFTDTAKSTIVYAKGYGPPVFPKADAPVAAAPATAAPATAKTPAATAPAAPAPTKPAASGKSPI